MKATTKEHQFRPRKLPARQLEDARRRFVEREGAAYVICIRV